MSPDKQASAAPREAWTRVAWGVALAAMVWVLYLGSRLPGRGPVAAYVFGPALLSLFALAVLIWGAVASARKRERPLRPRLIGFGLLAAVIGGANMPFPFPSRHDGHPSAVAFQLPIVAGEEWLVAWGGVRPEENLFAKAAADRRYGLALVKPGADGRTFAGSGLRLDDFHAYDAPVLAPAAGRVVRAVDGRPDRAPGGRAVTIGDGLGGEPFGNHAVIQVDEGGGYVFATHLRSGSLLVTEGDRIAAGDELGRVGHSGRDPFLDEPHIAIHLQDTPEPFWGQAIPWTFAGYEADGRVVDRGLPKGGLAGSGSFVGERVRRRP